MDGQKPAETGKPSKQFGRYFNIAQSFVKIPDNQFAHAWQLLSSKGRGITEDSSHAELKDPNAFLGFVDSDNLLRFYQNDTIFIENLFAMAKKSKAIFEVFDVIFNAWIFEIRLTANKGGIERRLQHSFGGGITAEGFGKILQEMERKRQQDEFQRQKQQQGGGMYS